MVKCQVCQERFAHAWHFYFVLRKRESNTWYCGIMGNKKGSSFHNKPPECFYRY